MPFISIIVVWDGQVLQVVRQLLSLLAGDSIDLFLLEKIKSLRTEHTLARLIHMIQSALWPGGKWYATVPPYSVAKAEYQAANPGARRGGFYNIDITQSSPPSFVVSNMSCLSHCVLNRIVSFIRIWPSTVMG